MAEGQRGCGRTGWPVPWVPSAARRGGAKGLFRTPQRSEGWRRGRQGLGQSGSMKDFLDKSCSHDIISLSDARQLHLQSPLQSPSRRWGPSLCRLLIPPFPSSEGHQRPGPSSRPPLEVGGLGVVPRDPEHSVVMGGVDRLPSQAQWATHLQRSWAPPKGTLTAFLINSPNSPVFVCDSYRGESQAANRWGC